MFSIGDVVQLDKNPWDEQIPEDLERYNDLKCQSQIVVDVKDICQSEVSSRQWIKTNLIEDWIDSSWFKDDTTEIISKFHKKLLSEQKDMSPELADVINKNFWELI